MNTKKLTTVTILGVACLSATYATNTQALSQLKLATPATLSPNTALQTAEVDCGRVGASAIECKGFHYKSNTALEKILLGYIKNHTNAEVNQALGANLSSAELNQLRQEAEDRAIFGSATQLHRGPSPIDPDSNMGRLILSGLVMAYGNKVMEFADRAADGTPAEEDDGPAGGGASDQLSSDAEAEADLGNVTQELVSNAGGGASDQLSSDAEAEADLGNVTQELVSNAGAEANNAHGAATDITNDEAADASAGSPQGIEESGADIVEESGLDTIGRGDEGDEDDVGGDLAEAGADAAIMIAVPQQRRASDFVDKHTASTRSHQPTFDRHPNNYISLGSIWSAISHRVTHAASTVDSGLTKAGNAINTGLNTAAHAIVRPLGNAAQNDVNHTKSGQRLAGVAAGTLGTTACMAGAKTACKIGLGAAHLAFHPVPKPPTDTMPTVNARAIASHFVAPTKAAQSKVSSAMPGVVATSSTARNNARDAVISAIDNPINLAPIWQPGDEPAPDQQLTIQHDNLPFIIVNFRHR